MSMIIAATVEFQQMNWPTAFVVAVGAIVFGWIITNIAKL